MSITMIACCDINNGIGDKDGNLLFNLPKDMKHFKSTTSGKVVVMGRKTWDSLPMKPLPRRKNYVLTRDESFAPVGAKVVNSIDEVLQLSKSHEVFIIGGGEIYNQFLPYADTLIITHVHVVELSATTFFPEFNVVTEWDLTNSQRHEADEKHPHSFAFTTYKRITK